MTVKKYCVLINSHHWLLRFEGKPQRMGFYTNRFVEAATGQEAAQLALSRLRQEAKFTRLMEIMLNPADDPPRLDIEAIKEVQHWQQPSGFGFYCEDAQATAEPEFEHGFEDEK